MMAQEDNNGFLRGSAIPTNTISQFREVEMTDIIESTCQYHSAVGGPNGDYIGKDMDMMLISGIMMMGLEDKDGN